MATGVQTGTLSDRLATRIREIRKVSGLSQTEFAREIGVSRSYLSEVEALKSKPSIDMVTGIASTFPQYASPHWLLLGFDGKVEGKAGEASNIPVSYECIIYCLAITRSCVIQQKFSYESDLYSRYLTVLINAYRRGYELALIASGDLNEAKLEAEGRCSMVAQSLMVGFDVDLIQGPLMPLGDQIVADE